jgi:site-specific DNA recombinase
VARPPKAKTRVGPLQPRLRAQRGRPLQPRRAQSTQDVPPAEWLGVPVSALVSEELFAAVAEQLQENRRRARIGRRGARYLLQGLLACKRVAATLTQARPSAPVLASTTRVTTRDSRCIGADAYRFGGERLCHHPQVRPDRLEEAVWQEVQGLLEAPQRLLEEYTRRLRTLVTRVGRPTPMGS